VQTGYIYNGSTQSVRRGLAQSRPESKVGDSIPSFAGAAPPADSGLPVVTHLIRWCRGGSLDQGEPVGGGRVEGGSPQRRVHGGGA
jgi:hypothetical protein